MYIYFRYKFYRIEKKNKYTETQISFYHVRCFPLSSHKAFQRKTEWVNFLRHMHIKFSLSLVANRELREVWNNIDNNLIVFWRIILAYILLLFFFFVVGAAAAYITDHREQDQNWRNNDYTVHQVFEPVRDVICTCQVRVVLPEKPK